MSNPHGPPPTDPYYGPGGGPPPAGPGPGPLNHPQGPGQPPPPHGPGPAGPPYGGEPVQRPYETAPHAPQSPPEPRYDRHRDGESPSRRTALVVHTLADIAAAILGLWIVLYLFDANQGSGFVQLVQGLAEWLAGWSQDIFTMENEHVRMVLNFGLPAVVYLFIGHGVAARIRRG
ncbi:hypothetical protein [Streptomyces sp. TR06-5]|uniref:hypothetical protein n=1 Tax=unclassified Streptomyces TaxID=2593676 RepID=UPI0039A3F63F